MNKLKEYEEEVKKGCGQDLPDCLCGENNRLCIGCREKLEAIQKCKELFKEMIKELQYDDDIMRCIEEEEDEKWWNRAIDSFSDELISQLNDLKEE